MIDCSTFPSGRVNMTMHFLISFNCFYFQHHGPLMKWNQVIILFLKIYTIKK